MDSVVIKIDDDGPESGDKKRSRERSKTPTKLQRSLIFPNMVKGLLRMSRKIFSFPLLTKSAKQHIIRTGSIEDEYRFGQQLSDQRQRKVRICYSKKTGTAFCCKTIKKINEHDPEPYNEVEMMQYLSEYQGIVQLHAVYDNCLEDSIHLVMELCAGGDLYDAVEKGSRFSENQAARIFKQIIRSVQYCHEKGVMHRDIKLENVFLADNNVVKLGDFDLSTFFRKGI